MSLFIDADVDDRAWTFNKPFLLNLIIIVLSMILVCLSYDSVDAFYDTDPKFVADNLWYSDTHTVAIKQGTTAIIALLIGIQIVSFLYSIGRWCSNISKLLILESLRIDVKNAYFDNSTKFGVFLITVLYNLIGSLVYSGISNSDRITTSKSYKRILGSQFDLFSATISSLLVGLSMASIFTGSMKSSVILLMDKPVKETEWIHANNYITNAQKLNSRRGLKEICVDYYNAI
jgi:hypothetical protein